MNEAVEAAAQGARLRRVVVIQHLISFGLPAGLFLAALLAIGLYPFGERTLSIWDLEITYTYFFEWFKNVLAGDGNLFYSFSKSLGGNMFAAFATICASPLNLLLALFPGHNPIPFVTLMATLKFGLAGLTSFIFLRKRFTLHPAITLSLSTSYALMMFMVTQLPNPMWLDAVVLLPLMMLGIYRLVRDGKVVLFFVTLLATILVDWYNGYMACLFAIPYFLFEGAIYAPEAKEKGIRVWVGCMVRPGRFAAAYTLAIAGSFTVLLPTALELLQGKGSYAVDILSPDLRYSLPSLPKAVFIGVYEKEYLPQIYTGMLTLASMLCFMLSPRVGRRERIAALAFLAVILGSTWFAPLDRIWCGFRDGNSFYCRFAYLASALFIFFAARGLEELDRKDAPRLAAIALVIVAGALATLMTNGFMDPRFVAIAIATAIAYPAFMVAFPRIRSKRAGTSLAVVLLIAVSCELCVNAAYFTLMRTDTDDRADYSRYEAYFSQGDKALAELKAHDGSLGYTYRVAKTYNFLSPYQTITSNESMVYGYSQLSLYDSAYDDRVQNFASAAGYTDDDSCRIAYTDPIPFTDALLGFKYVASPQMPMGFEDIGLKETQDGNRFYRNPDALPLGFVADESCLSEELGMSTSLIEEDNGHDPFANQNKIASEILGRDVEIYRRLPAEVSESDDQHVTWTIPATGENRRYGYIKHIGWQSIGLYTSGGLVHSSYIDGWSHGIFPVLGNEAAEATVTIEARDAEAAADHLDDPDSYTLYAYECDETALAEALAELADEPWEITQIDDGHVEGTCDADEAGVMFTSIPYDRGWHVEVNGKAIEPSMALGTFMAIPVEKGHNAIVLSYEAPGLVAGGAASAVSVVLLILFALLCRKRDGKRKATEEMTEKGVLTNAGDIGPRPAGGKHIRR